MDARYQIGDKVGQGGIGEVFLGLDTRLGRQVAIKKIRTDTEVESCAAERLLREAEALSALQHPNVVTIYDVGMDGDTPYVVTEYVDGEEVDSIVKRGVLTEADFENFARQCLEGLTAAHGIGLLHRDLKPGNVMVAMLPGGGFQVKILDFGLAKFSEAPTLQTIDQAGTIMGSIYFMAPEQFERRELDTRTDLYALGCLFYYTLAGGYPFGGDNAPVVMEGHLQHRVRFLKEMRPDLPGWLCNWVMGLFSRQMEDRPPSAREALSLLEQRKSGLQRKPAAKKAPMGIGQGGAARVPAAAPAASGGSGKAIWIWVSASFLCVGILAAVMWSQSGDPTDANVRPQIVENEDARGIGSENREARPTTEPEPELDSRLEPEDPPNPETKPDPATPTVAAVPELLITEVIPLNGDGVEVRKIEVGEEQQKNAIAATEMAALSGMLGEEMTIHGVPTRVGKSKSGKTYYLNFAPKGDAISLAFRVATVGDIFTEEVLEGMVGKEVVAKGEVAKDFSGLHIVVSSEDQILSGR